MSWREALREPLLHFLIAGAAVFALLGESNAPEDRRIVIDAAMIERLAGAFAQSFRRQPTAAELDAMISEEVRDEVYYREALRLRLDRDDTVVRRRMRLKMEGLATASLDAETPDDATLQHWLETHSERFAGEPSYSFDQRFLDGSLALPGSLENAGRDDVAAQFGEAFADALADLPVGRWQRVVSGFGRHEVRLRARVAVPPPRLADVRRRVENDWRAAQARARTERAFRQLLSGYQVAIKRTR